MAHLYATPQEFEAAAEAALAAAASARQPAALLVADVDGFATLSARYGPQGADDILETVTRLALSIARDDDLVGCGDDDKVQVLLPGATADDGARVGERLCAAVRAHRFSAGGEVTTFPVTLSIGVAAAPDHGDTYDKVFGPADAARARLKGQGRDGTLVAPLAHHTVLHRPLGIDRFVGRVEELRALERALRDADEGRPGVVAILGELGTGTASIVRQLEPEVRLRGGHFVVGRSVDQGVREPYGVWVSILRALLRLPGAPTQLGEELPNLLEPPAQRSEAERRAGSKYRLLQELSGAVREAAATAPLVLVLEDMEAADDTSWDALEHLVEQLDSERLLICLTHRIEPKFAESAQRRQTLTRFQIYREIPLSRLTRDEVKRWLESAFHHQDVGREFLAFLYRHTEGNPLFISQLLRALVEIGALWHSGSRWEWSPVSELRLPPGLRPLIRYRISRLSAGTQAVLGAAAIVGREFDVDLVTSGGAGTEAAVRLALSEALAAGFLRPTVERRRHAFAFANEEIAEVVRETLPEDRAAVFHGNLGRVLESRPSCPRGEVAYHFDRAGVADGAHRMALVAAMDAERVYAHTSAEKYLNVAARNSTSPGELAEVRVRLAQLAETGGRFDEAEELCDLAIEWFAGQGDDHRVLTLRRMRERARIELGQPARVTVAALGDLDERAKELGSDRERVAILAMMSQSLGRLGDRQGAERLATECVSMAERIGDTHLLAEALVRLGSTVAVEAPARARSMYEQALGLFEVTGDVRGASGCYNNIGIVAQFESDLEAAEKAYTTAISVARAGGMPDLWGRAAMNLGVLWQKCGDYDRSREQFGEALALFAALKNSEAQLAALFNLANVERELGLWDSAAELYQATAPLAERIGQIDIELGALAGAGLCFVDLGNLDRAREFLDAAKQGMHARSDWFQCRELVEALEIRVAALDGSADAALDRFDSALALAEPADLYSAAWLAAVCADTLLEHSPARVRSSISRYAAKVGKLGYPEMTRRYDALARR